MNILIIDDESSIRKTLTYCLAAEGHTVIAVSNADDAAEEIGRLSCDMAFLDLRLGDEDGMRLIPRLLSVSPWTRIVVITAHASIETAVQAIRDGAVDYIAKPFTPDQVKLITHRIDRMRAMETELAALRDDMRRIAPESRFTSKTPAMQRVLETLKKAAASEAVILLQGESGTGKSVLARAVHQWSPRSGKPMAVVSCPAVPSELLESELFGHVKGAFTGAVRTNPGRIAACEGGTLFLDEIGEMPLSVQAKLLRFIQDKEYERLGDSAPRKADIRIIVATNADLEKRVAGGTFREDLFHRLNVIRVTIPPLRERPADIMPMARDFLAYFCDVNHKSSLGFSEEAENWLTAHFWSGNIRELRNTLERAVILGSGERIDVDDLPRNMAPARAIPTLGDKVSLAVIEELHIRRVLASTVSLQEAANILGIDQATLWRRRKAYGI